MIDQYLQCCYTNATHEVGGVVSSGWETVAVSPGMAQNTYKQCEKFQKANSNISKEMLDENGETLNLFEIAGDGAHLIVMRTQYGLFDRLGRANMFSHAFLLPCRNGEIMDDPNSFLTIANENFKESEQEALAPYAEMIRLAPWTLQSAMERCGLSMETYLTLVQAVYTQAMDKKMLKPLYIQYDGSEEEMRGLLFCIYSALPLFLRRTLSVASSPSDNTGNKNIIFSKYATKQSYYIVPSAGETSVLSDRLVRRIGRLGFVDYVFTQSAQMDWPNYFHILEEKAMELGNATASSEVVLKIAHLLLMSQDVSALSEEDIVARIGDALRAGIWGNACMEEYLLTLLEMVMAQKLVLSEEDEASLLECASASVYLPFKECAQKYIFGRFRTLTSSEAAQRLGHMSDEMFQTYRAELKQDDEGLRILDGYYVEVAVPAAGLTWDGLTQIIKEIGDLGVRMDILRVVYDKSKELYAQLVLSSKEHGFAQVPQAYQNYAHMVDLFVPVQYGQAAREKYKMTAKQYFWEQVDLEQFDFEIQDPYRSLQINTPLSHAVNAFCELPDILLVQRDHKAFFLGMWDCFAQMNQCREPAQCDLAKEGLLAHVKMQNKELTPQFEAWYQFVLQSQSREMLALVLDLYGDLCAHEEVSMVKHFVSLSYLKPNRGLLQEIASALIAVCLEWDCVDKPILLDTWLTLGKGNYPNCFEIFNDETMEVLSMEASEVVAQSKCLEEEFYRNAAQMYIDMHGEEARTVKKWLAEYKRLEKRNGTSGGTGLLSGLPDFLQIPKFGNREDKGDGGRSGRRGKREK